MPKAAIRLADSAFVDLEAIIGRYAELDVPEIGEQMMCESIEDLVEYPEMGRIVPEFQLPFLSELIRPPFRIVYRCDSKPVRIVRVWRSERLLELPDESGRGWLGAPGTLPCKVLRWLPSGAGGRTRRSRG